MEHPESTKFDPKPDWNDARPVLLAKPTWWPMALALGATFICWGLVTSLFIVGIGIIVFAISLAGWIGDIRNEQHEEHQEH